MQPRALLGLRFVGLSQCRAVPLPYGPQRFPMWRSHVKGFPGRLREATAHATRLSEDAYYKQFRVRQLLKKGKPETDQTSCIPK